MKNVLWVLFAIVAVAGARAESQTAQFKKFQKMSGRYVVNANSYFYTQHTLSWQEDTIDLFLGDGIWSRTYYVRTYRNTYEEDEQPTWDFEAWSMQIPFNWHIEYVDKSATIVISHLYPAVEAQIMQRRYVTEKDSLTLTTPGEVNMAMLEQEFKDLRLSISSPKKLNADISGYRGNCDIVRIKSGNTLVIKSKK